MIKYAKQLLALALTNVVLLACTKKQDDGSYGCTTQLRQASLKFKVLDASTRQDLFFSDNPRLPIKDAYFFRRSDKSRKDTIRPIVMGAGDSRFFMYDVDFNTKIDTLVLKTGNLPDNLITYQVSKVETPCPDYRFNQLTFNGTLLKGDNYGVYLFSK